MTTTTTTGHGNKSREGDRSFSKGQRGPVTKMVIFLEQFLVSERVPVQRTPFREYFFPAKIFLKLFLDKLLSLSCTIGRREK